MKCFIILIFASLSRGIALEWAELRSSDVAPSSKTLESLTEKMKKNWNVAKFAGSGLDGVVCWKLVGSGVSTTQIAIYARGKDGKLWTLRVYQEIRIRAVKVKSDAQKIIITTFDDVPISEFSIRHLDAVDAN